jgi:hypothetical protein
VFFFVLFFGAPQKEFPNAEVDYRDGVSNGDNCSIDGETPWSFGDRRSDVSDSLSCEPISQSKENQP